MQTRWERLRDLLLIRRPRQNEAFWGRGDRPAAPTIRAGTGACPCTSATHTCSDNPVDLVNLVRESVLAELSDHWLGRGCGGCKLAALRSAAKHETQHEPALVNRRYTTRTATCSGFPEAGGCSGCQVRDDRAMHECGGAGAGGGLSPVFELEVEALADLDVDDFVDLLLVVADPVVVFAALELGGCRFVYDDHGIGVQLEC